MLAADLSTGSLFLNGLFPGRLEAALDWASEHLTPVRLELGKVLYEPGMQIESVYFPTTSIVSLQYEMGDGRCSELAVVGNEGMVGIAMFMGGETTSSRAVVDSPGNAYRLKARTLKKEFYRDGALRDRLLRYTQALITQISQGSVCNRHHTVEQQLCRWLAGRLDRQHSNEVIATHELIAARLGVRRGTVAVAAANLQQAGLIRYQRGHVVVLDLVGLKERCCECYAVVKHENGRLMQISTRCINVAAPRSSIDRTAAALVVSNEYAGVV